MALRLKKDGTYAALPQPRLQKPKERITFPKASRSFTTQQRRQMEGHAKGRCEGCGTTLETGWHGHHTLPYHLGGKTDILNGEALCPTCHRDRHRPEQREPDARQDDGKRERWERYFSAGKAPESPDLAEPEAAGPSRTTVG